MTHDSAGPQFLRKLQTSLNDGSFVRLRLSALAPGKDHPERIEARLVELRAGRRLSFTLNYPKRDVTKNLEIAAGLDWVATLLPDCRNAYLWTTQGDWQFTATAARSRLVAHPAAFQAPPSLAHDEARDTLLDTSAQPWLHGLGVTTAHGQVAARMADKHRQISRYLEILSHLARDCGWGECPPQSAHAPSPRPSALRGEREGAGISPAPSPLTPALSPEEGAGARLVFADMGCGKGYLTFGAWHLFCRRWRLPARVIGVEVRPELVAAANQLARQVGATELEFVPGTIATAKLPRVDALVALHACDTATDDALRRGILARAKLIVVAPCCHQELRPRLGRPEPLAPVLRHGLMSERMSEWVTDGLRALHLEWAGYETRLIEFVASEHTPKNLMIAAVRRAPAFTQPAAREKIERFKAFYGIDKQGLDDLLLAKPLV